MKFCTNTISCSVALLDSSLPCLLQDEVIEMTDSLIFIAQRKSWDTLQTQKYSAHCDCSIKDGQQNPTIVVSLSLFPDISEYHLIGITCRYMSWNIFTSTSGWFSYVDDMSTQLHFSWKVWHDFVVSRYFRVPFDWNNMSIYVVKYIYVYIRMIFSCRWHVDIIACRWQPYQKCI